SLIGNGSANTTIDGSSSGDVVLVTEDNVRISNFNISTSGATNQDSGIEVESDHTEISYCLFFNNRRGVYFSNSNWNAVHNASGIGNLHAVNSFGGHNNTIRDNLFLSGGTGITLWWTQDHSVVNNTCSKNDDSGLFLRTSSFTHVENNICTNNTKYGVWFFGDSPWNHNNTLEDNNCSANGEAGIYMDQSRDNVLNDTICWENGMYGIRLLDSNSNTLTNNDVAWNTNHGIGLQSSDENILSSNTCHENGDYGIYVWPGNGNVLAGNLIQQNRIGIHLISGSENNEIHTNNITGNQEYGINATNNGGQIINATQNWWGNNSGPYHPTLNPSGTGDNITDDVLFDPWTGKQSDEPTTLYVDDDAAAGGNGSLEHPYQTIQEAIDNATEGDTIRVFNGTYFENVVVNKTVSLIGNGSEDTIIDGSGTGGVVTITADWITLNGFNVTNGSSGITIRSNNNTITNNSCTNFDSDYGIQLDSARNNTLMNNTSSHNFYGIYLTDSSRNNISKNTCNSNQEDGIRLWKSNNNTFLNNTISLNGDKGIYLYSTNDTLVLNNSIFQNQHGIFLTISSQNNSAHYNDIFTNTNYGIKVTNNDGVTINATENWWGNNSGPYHLTLNPEGTGDNVTDDVLFDPWTGKQDTTILYVAGYGNDDTGDGSEGNPYLTIQKAMDWAANDTHTIRVFEGTYNEEIMVNRSLAIVGNGTGITIIDGSLGSGDVVNVTADGVTIGDLDVVNGVLHGVNITADNVTLQNCSISDNLGNGIIAMNVTGLIIRDCVVEDNQFDG
ncbi:MAG: right-handed parallel beta-helix repeat-containing protein, partial [Thermoplasmata archaeon]|nr:right-handed parallel beta-helix repeat-containing protein [Thermoplasmata archaeon]